MNKPEWFPWDDDVTNENGWYGRHEMDAYVDALTARVKELESKLAVAKEEADYAVKAYSEFQKESMARGAHIFYLKEKLALARECLEFYADKDNWDMEEMSPTIWDDGDIDCGKRARAALEKLGEG